MLFTVNEKFIATIWIAWLTTMRHFPEAIKVV